MKTTLAVLSLLFCTSAMAQSSGIQANQPITRYPAISTSLYTNILAWDAVAQSYSPPQHINVTEGADITAQTAYSGFGTEMYFAVCVPSLPDGGTVLEIDPLPANSAGVLYFGLTIHDVVNHVDYYAPFTQGSGNQIAPFTIAGQQFWIYISYPSTFGWYPHISITWGKGSGPNNVGTIVDDMSQVVTDDVAPTNSTVSIQLAKGIQDVPDGVYVGNSTTNENCSIQSSSDLIHWTTETNQAIGIIGYTYVFQFPPAVGNKYFRAKMP